MALCMNFSSIPVKNDASVVKLFNVILIQGKIPQDWLLGNIILIYKKKRNPSDSDNYRDIIFFSCLAR